jgi:hypothetical protein
VSQGYWVKALLLSKVNGIGSVVDLGQDLDPNLSHVRILIQIRYRTSGFGPGGVHDMD